MIVRSDDKKLFGLEARKERVGFTIMTSYKPSKGISGQQGWKNTNSAEVTVTVFDKKSQRRPPSDWWAARRGMV